MSTNFYMGSPSIIEKAERNMCSIDIYSKLFTNRIIWIGTEINEEVASDVISQLLCLESISETDPITIYLNTPGGVISDGLAIYDTMKVIKPKVTVINVGLAASMGSILLSGGDSRKALKHSRVLIHSPHGGFYGTTPDLSICMQQIEKDKNALFEILAKNTNHSIEDIAKLAERDFWLDAKEALSFGIIDEII